jgi:hypothetical protein
MRGFKTIESNDQSSRGSWVMKSKIWLLISGACLISIHLQADESDYGNRQFTINPGNVMDGMYNPMRNLFGGRYAPPHPYQPGYAYPGAGYGYPPPHPGYQPQGGVYPSYSPTQQLPAPSLGAQPSQTPAASDYSSATTPAEPTYYEQFRFRPLDKSDVSTGMAPKAAHETTGDQSILTPQQGYEPSLAMPPGTEAGQMKFRPLDKPGYTE